MKYHKGGKDKMTEIQRINSDIATMDRREAVDKILIDNRDRNDALTQERRFQADKTMSKSRLKNDELTADRRDMEDVRNGKPSLVLAAYVLASVVLIVAIFSMFI
jgi:hypothetical protein